MLPESPRGLGLTIEDRQAWEAVGGAANFGGLIQQAEALRSQPSPVLTDDLYLDFSRTGNRRRAERVQYEHEGRVSTLVMAECIENRGRFLPAIEEAVRVLCGEKTWLMPAHDSTLTNFKGASITIDLFAPPRSLGPCHRTILVGGQAPPGGPKTHPRRVGTADFQPLFVHGYHGLARAVVADLRQQLERGLPLAGVIGAALATIDSRQRRAFFVAAMEQRISKFLHGITPDGYCSEGVGYWNYGFGHYTMLAETVWQATGGKVDMLQDPQARQIALFGRRMEILPDVFPAFADCHPGERPTRTFRPSSAGVMVGAWKKSNKRVLGWARCGPPILPGGQAILPVWECSVSPIRRLRHRRSRPARPLCRCATGSPTPAF